MMEHTDDATCRSRNIKMNPAHSAVENHLPHGALKQPAPLWCCHLAHGAISHAHKDDVAHNRKVNYTIEDDTCTNNGINIIRTHITPNTCTSACTASHIN